MFKVGDRVHLGAPIARDGHEPLGTVTGFNTPGFAAELAAPDDVLVRWDSGLELAHAPAGLVLARGSSS